METTKTYGIQPFMDRAGFDAGQLAKRLNIPLDEVQQWASGKTSVPYEQAGTVATLLGVEREQIIGSAHNTS